MVTEARLAIYLKQLKLPAVARHYKALAREAEEQGRTHVEYLTTLLEQETLQRDENRVRERLRKARFPYMKTLEAFDFSAIPSLNMQKVIALSRCDFVRDKENALLVGNPGTGKTHLAIALGACACRLGMHVRFYTAAALANELMAAQQEHRLHRLERQWLAPDLVICDELGYLPFDQTGAQLLFQFFSVRYERGSLLLTTNLEFARWTEVFGDEKLTAALLDRLAHKAHVLTMNGDSYRFKESLRRQQQA